MEVTPESESLLKCRTLPCLTRVALSQKKSGPWLGPWTAGSRTFLPSYISFTSMPLCVPCSSKHGSCTSRVAITWVLVWTEDGDQTQGLVYDGQVLCHRAIPRPQALHLTKSHRISVRVKVWEALGQQGPGSSPFMEQSESANAMAYNEKAAHC